MKRYKCDDGADVEIISAESHMEAALKFKQKWSLCVGDELRVERIKPPKIFKRFGQSHVIKEVE